MVSMTNRIVSAPALVRLAAQLSNSIPDTDLSAGRGLYPSRASSRSAVRMSGLLSHPSKTATSLRLGGREGLLPRTPRSASTSGRYHGTTVIDQTFRWLNHLDYRGHTWRGWNVWEVVTLRRRQTPQSRFVHLTNLTVTARTVRTLSRTGRLRWKIENEVSNTQKHLGYSLEH